MSKRTKEEGNKEKEDKILDMIADLLVDDFLAMEAAGILPKPLKRVRKSVRK